MRIALLTSQFARSSDTFIRSEVNQLRELGVVVDTFSIRRPPLQADADADVVRHQAETVYLAERGRWTLLRTFSRLAVVRPRSFVGALALAWRLRPPGLSGLVKQAGYLVVAAELAEQIRRLGANHLHNHIAENSATVAAIASRIAGVTHSLTVHGPRIFFDPFSWRLREKLELADLTICITDFCRSQCMALSSPIAWPKMRVVRCGVQQSFLDPLAFHSRPGKREAPDGPPLLLNVGRLCEDKGHHVLIAAAAELKQRGLSFRIEIVGDGPLRPDLEAAIEREGLHGCVSIVGWKPSSYVRDAMIRSLALVLPSFAEGLPIVLMESLALRTPVVATSIAGVSELVANGESGWIIPPGNERRLAMALAEALATPPEELERMGEHGREAVIRLHFPRTQAAALLDAIESIRPSIGAHASQCGSTGPVSPPAHLRPTLSHDCSKNVGSHESVIETQSP